MSMLPIVSSVSELQSIFAKYGSGPMTELAASVRNVRAELLTAEETKILSEYVTKNVFFGFLEPNVPGLMQELIGLQEATPEDTIFATYGGKAYTAKRNANNRDKSAGRIGPATKDGTYTNLMARGLFATLPTDPLCVDWFGQGKSLQHRSDAFIATLLANPDAQLPLAFFVVGLPPQLGDWTDKAKNRTKKDDNKCDTTMIPVDWIQLVNLHVAGLTTAPANRSKERSECLIVQSKVSETVQRRFNGLDIYPTGAKQTTEEEQKMLALFGEVTVEKFDSEIVNMPETDMNALSYLVCKVVASARTQSGKIDSLWAKTYFSPSVVASAIILASNDETYIENEVSERFNPDDDLTIEQKAELRLQIKAEIVAPTAPIRIDFQLADEVLTLLGQSTDKEGGGPLGDCLAKLSEQTKVKFDKDGRKYDYKPQSIASMSSMVQLIKNIREDKLGESVNTKYIKRNDTYSPAYRCFGGRDIGYVNTKKSDK
jgi:hypothetical protein